MASFDLCEEEIGSDGDDMLTINDLPNDVLYSIFSAVPPHERRAVVPLVCKRWNATSREWRSVMNSTLTFDFSHSCRTVGRTAGVQSVLPLIELKPYLSSVVIVKRCLLKHITPLMGYIWWWYVFGPQKCREWAVYYIYDVILRYKNIQYMSLVSIRLFPKWFCHIYSYFFFIFQKKKKSNIFHNRLHGKYSHMQFHPHTSCSYLSSSPQCMGCISETKNFRI